MASNWAEANGRYGTLVDYLDRTIPKDELARLKKLYHSGVRELHGGAFRGFERVESRVATYNNTRENAQEIHDWYQRARELAEKEASQYDHSRTADPADTVPDSVPS